MIYRIVVLVPVLLFGPVLWGCSTAPAIPVTTASPALTNAQVASKVANCVVAALPSCAPGTPLQVCAGMAALQCATGY